MLVLKLPVWLWASKGDTECYLLAFNLHLGLHLPSAKWEFAVELPSLQPLQGQCYVYDTYTTRGPTFRWGDPPVLALDWKQRGLQLQLGGFSSGY